MTTDSTAYVRAALGLQGYEFDETRIADIVAEFSLIETIAQVILTLQLASDVEPAAVFRP